MHKRKTKKKRSDRAMSNGVSFSQWHKAQATFEWLLFSVNFIKWDNFSFFWSLSAQKTMNCIEFDILMDFPYNFNSIFFFILRINKIIKVSNGRLDIEWNISVVFNEKNHFYPSTILNQFTKSVIRCVFCLVLFCIVAYFISWCYCIGCVCTLPIINISVEKRLNYLEWIQFQSVIRT